jgi:hypothetical protein
MPADLLDAAPSSHALIHTESEREYLLAVAREELASLRFATILTARWEAAAQKDVARRNEMRADLKTLRRNYSDKIDEIAMKFGVQDAMVAQREVERSVFVPKFEDAPELADEDNDPCI